MGELGDACIMHHQEVGQAAKKLGIDLFLSCGIYSALAAKAFGRGAQHFSTQEHLLLALDKELYSRQPF